MSPDPCWLTERQGEMLREIRRGDPPRWGCGTIMTPFEQSKIMADAISQGLVRHPKETP